jgi:hypothetical protein
VNRNGRRTPIDAELMVRDFADEEKLRDVA